ncbi:MAG: hypothetical protein RLY86_1900 [Pseudomonadota bacterium]|jgi:hypothetical protein
MQFMMIIYETEADFARRNDPAEAGPYWGAWTGYARALAEAGIIVSAGGLMPPVAATTLRLKDGQRQVQDGPFADTKEQLGGFFVIDVPDLDTALDWAARCPAAGTGGVELRPVLPPPPAP